MPDFRPLAIQVPEVLLPAPGVDLSRWAVHPELGLVTNSGLDGLVILVGVALSFRP